MVCGEVEGRLCGVTVVGLSSGIVVVSGCGSVSSGNSGNSVSSGIAAVAVVVQSSSR